MTGERCRHCGGAIEYVDGSIVCSEDDYWESWWHHVPPVRPWPAHEAAPAFGGGS